MKKNYNLVFIITLLLFVMSISITFVNYKVSLETAKDQLKNQALPLSLDNIYTDIQKHIIEPYLISSMMAHDTFLVDWIKYDTGDDVLIRISKLLSENIRKTDLFARWGGEEFVILFVNSDINDAFKLSNKICKMIEKDEKLISYVDSSVTASFGLTQIQKKDKLDDILKRADKAMYQAKHSGKNQVIKI